LILGGGFLDNDLYRSLLDESARTLELLFAMGVEKKRPLKTPLDADGAMLECNDVVDVACRGGGK
jgi:hypothetical protein